MQVSASVNEKNVHVVCMWRRGNKVGMGRREHDLVGTGHIHFLHLGLFLLIVVVGVARERGDGKELRLMSGWRIVATRMARSELLHRLEP